MGKSTSLATRRSGFDSRRLHSCRWSLSWVLGPAGGCGTPSRAAAEEVARECVRHDPVSQQQLADLTNVEASESAVVSPERRHAVFGGSSRQRAADGGDFESHLVDARAASIVRA